MSGDRGRFADCISVPSPPAVDREQPVGVPKSGHSARISVNGRMAPIGRSGKARQPRSHDLRFEMSIRFRLSRSAPQTRSIASRSLRPGPVTTWPWLAAWAIWFRLRPMLPSSPMVRLRASSSSLGSGTSDRKRARVSTGTYVAGAIPRAAARSSMRIWSSVRGRIINRAVLSDLCTDWCLRDYWGEARLQQHQLNERPEERRLTELLPLSNRTKPCLHLRRHSSHNELIRIHVGPLFNKSNRLPRHHGLQASMQCHT